MAAPQANRKIETVSKAPAPEPGQESPAAPAAPTVLSAASSDLGADVEIRSPAKALQDALSAAVAELEPSRKWSPRATALFILIVCGGFWLTVGALVYLQLRR